MPAAPNTELAERVVRATATLDAATPETAPAVPRPTLLADDTAIAGEIAALVVPAARAQNPPVVRDPDALHAAEQALAAAAHAVDSEPAEQARAAVEAAEQATATWQQAEDEAQRAVQEQQAIASAVAAAVHAPNGELPAQALCAIPWQPDEMLRCDAADALTQLNEAFAADHGRNLSVVDGYRTYAEQVQVKAARGHWAAPPGTSNHGLGLAVDLGGGINTFGSPEYAWIVANAGRFGWVHPPQMDENGPLPEPWHWEYGAAETVQR